MERLFYGPMLDFIIFSNDDVYLIYVTILFKIGKILLITHHFLLFLKFEYKIKYSNFKKCQFIIFIFQFFSISQNLMEFEKILMPKSLKIL
jgi:hypothetical protein